MRLFAVVGMHRSGTSIVSRGLNLLGAHLGPDEDLMPPKPDNPKGFWETLSVAQLHDDLVAHLGGRWDRPPVLEEGWEQRPGVLPFAERLRAIVRSHFAGADLAVWKDPRGSLFLPLWRQVVPIAGIVLCLRPPEEVARSLGRREGIDSERTAALWLRYVVTAYRDDASPLIVRFEEAYQAPDALLNRLASFVGAAAPREPTRDTFRTFVDPVLRHHSQPAGDSGPLLRLANAAYALVTREPRENVMPFFDALWGGWQHEAWVESRGIALDSLRKRLGPSAVELLK